MKGFVAVVSMLAAAGSVAATMHKRISHTGDLTWFNVPSGNDACGQPIPANSAAVHVSKDLWQNGRNCGQWMSITANGKQDYAVVTGVCNTCVGDHIDVTQATFQSFADPDVGLLKATWSFKPMGYNPPNMEECE